MELKITIKIDGEEVKDFNVDVSKEDITQDSFSQYARFFDEGSEYWTNDPEYNFMFLKTQQNYACAKLRNRGYLFLNDVYEMLGIPKSKEGQLVGWIYDEKNPIGDNCVDFGLYNNSSKDFINGDKNTVLLDFNVDGNIYDNVF